MITVYWYHDGQVRSGEFSSVQYLTAFDSPIPINAQVYIPPPLLVLDWNNPNRVNSPWYQVNARNRLVPVPIGVCGELRAALLIMGISMEK